MKPPRASPALPPPPPRRPRISAVLRPGTDDPTPPGEFAAGTGQMASCCPCPPDAVEELAALEASFDRCLAGLHMFFQPIVRPDGSLFGHEALLRSRDVGLPDPGAIIGAAERLSRVDRLGRAVRNTVGRLIGAADPAQGTIFVNLHALDLFDRTLTSPFSPLTKVARRIVLEVTEQGSLEGLADLRYRIAELREVGYRIALDDLGAGPQRTSRLTPLDTDFVKLDMSLVRDVDAHPMKRQLIGAITTMCREHGITVVGEGVETTVEREVLVALGCDLLQGYLIARPGPPFPVPPVAT